MPRPHHASIHLFIKYVWCAYSAMDSVKSGWWTMKRISNLREHQEHSRPPEPTSWRPHQARARQSHLLGRRKPLASMPLVCKMPRLPSWGTGSLWPPAHSSSVLPPPSLVVSMRLWCTPSIPFIKQRLCSLPADTAAVWAWPRHWRGNSLSRETWVLNRSVWHEVILSALPRHQNTSK